MKENGVVGMNKARKQRKGGIKSEREPKNHEKRREGKITSQQLKKRSP